MNVLIQIVFLTTLMCCCSVTAMTWPGIPVPHSECSKTNSRIVSGLKADANQFPWFATVRSHTENDLQSFCGGSIISQIFILTAAHCTNGFVSFTIGFGSNTLNAPMVTMHTSDVIQHADYNSDNLNNDISLIKLPNPLTFSSQIQSIRLPRMSETQPDKFIYAKAQVCGYGRTDDGSTALSDSLNWVEKRIVSNTQCAQTYGPSVVLSSTLCAIGWDYDGQSTCNGDSGGPLVIDDGGIYLQIGIVSFVSHKGCSSGHPAGYVRIASFLKWISMNARILIQP